VDFLDCNEKDPAHLLDQEASNRAQRAIGLEVGRSGNRIEE
jgi:hypothetical protein